MMLAVPVLAQTGNITVTLDCDNDPEGVTVNNATDASITVTGVTSSEEPDGDPEAVSMSRLQRGHRAHRHRR